jgi:hypothetical protein
VRPLICLTSFHAAAQTKVTTWHYNNGLNGANTTEKILTASNVKVSTFGKLFTQPVDGLIVGQPLYLPGVTIPNKGLHNVVYVATLSMRIQVLHPRCGEPVCSAIVPQEQQPFQSV